MRLILSAVLVCVLGSGAFADRYIAEVGSLRNTNAISLETIDPMGVVKLSNTLVWEIPDVGPEDVGTAWILDADNAASYGWNWQEATDLVAAKGFGFTGRIYWPGSGGVKSSICCSGGRLVLDRIEFKLVNWSTKPDLTRPGYTKYHAVTHTAIFAETPEPSSAWLLCIGLLCFNRHRHQPPNCRM